MTARASGAGSTGPLVQGADTVLDVFEAAVEAFGEHEAIVDGPNRISYAEWWDRAGSVAGVLQAEGVGSRDVVVSVIPTGIDYAVTFLAAVRCGAVMSGLNPRLGRNEVERILAITRPAAVVVDEPGRELLPLGITAPTLERPELSCVDGADPPRPRVAAEDPVAIVWTSGTTGSPKGAWYDHRALEGAALCAGDLTAPRDRRLVPLPFMHAGFMTKLWDLTASANTIVTAPGPWTASGMLDQMVAERITVAVGVPTQWTKLLELPGLDSADLSSLRVAVTSTAPAPPELVKAMRERLGCAVLVRYALTETGVGTGTRADDPADVVHETVGRAQVGVEVRVVDEEGCRLPPGVVGRVEMHTLAQMRGYWNDPDRTREAFTADGWVRTGDLGWLRRDGNLVLRGRSSDMYIRSGYNIYPLEVEHVLAEHPAVAAVAVAGSSAPVIGEEGVAVVVPTDPASPPDLESLRAFVADRIADYKRPDRLVLVEDLPRNDTGKVLRAALRALVDAVPPSSGAPSPAPTPAS